MSDLFEAAAEEIKKNAPLAERIRPSTLDEIIGQEHLLAKDALLRKAIEKDELRSIILWGPPGTGKTTLARVIATITKSHFMSFSAVLSGVKEIREIVAQAKDTLKYHNRKTIFFVDEIHRFNKGQQDAFLPYVEDGTIVLIGATTENPSFEVNAALRSRSRVFVLYPLSEENINQIAHRALSHPNGLAKFSAKLSEEAMTALVQSAHGDARECLNILELAVAITEPDEKGVRNVPLKSIEEASQKKALLYDKAGEEHFNVISALHKSVRGSDPQAALYWVYRMLDAGEDPLYVARRIIRMAVEDIGLAEPQALGICVAAKETYHFLGSPEGELALAQAVVYLATAPKSNALYTASHEVKKDIERYGALPVPLHIRNAPTGLMKELGYGKGYAYDHDYEDGFSGQDHLPEELMNRKYYKPKPWGFEREIEKRIEYWEKKKRELKDKP